MAEQKIKSTYAQKRALQARGKFSSRSPFVPGDHADASPHGSGCAVERFGPPRDPCWLCRGGNDRRPMSVGYDVVDV